MTTKRERTRAALIEGATNVIADKGIEATRITDITEHVGVANGTFYNYFPDKEEVVRAVALEVAAATVKALDTAMAGERDAAVRVVLATSRAIVMAVADPAFGRVLTELIGQRTEVHDDVVRFLRADLLLGVEQGRFDIEASPFFIDQLLALVLSSVRSQIGAGEDAGLTSQTCEHVLRLCGVPPASARKLVRRVLETGRRAET